MTGFMISDRDHISIINYKISFLFWYDILTQKKEVL